MNIVGIILGALIGAVFSGLIIWIVGKLGLGIEVNGFKPAFVAAIAIAALNIVIHLIWGALGYAPPAGWVGALINLTTSAAVMVSAGSLIKGLNVKGYSGALVASVAISAVSWLVDYLLKLLF